MREPKVIVVTLNWNGLRETLECLEPLIRMDYSNYEIVVVDNGSEDNSPELIRRRFPQVKVIENGRNLGYAEGFNVGLRYSLEAGAEYTLVMNNDTVIDPMAMRALVEIAEGDESIGFVSGKVFHYREPEIFQSTGIRWDMKRMEGWLIGNREVDRGQYDSVAERDFVDDVFMLVRRKVVEQVGGYNNNFFLYFEETDWNARVKRAGFRILYTPHAKIWHKGMSSTGGKRNPKYFYYFTRNRVLFVARNFSKAQLVKFLVEQLGCLAPITALRFIKSGELDCLRGFLLGWSSGLSWVFRKFITNTI